MINGFRHRVLVRPFSGVEFNPEMLAHEIIDDGKRKWKVGMIKLLLSEEAAT